MRTEPRILARLWLTGLSSSFKPMRSKRRTLAWKICHPGAAQRCRAFSSQVHLPNAPPPLSPLQAHQIALCLFSALHAQDSEILAMSWCISWQLGPQILTFARHSINSQAFHFKQCP